MSKFFWISLLAVSVTMSVGCAKTGADDKPATSSKVSEVPAVEVDVQDAPADAVTAPVEVVIPAEVVVPAKVTTQAPPEPKPEPKPTPTPPAKPKAAAVVITPAVHVQPAIVNTVARREMIIREWQPNRGVFGGWLVGTFPLTKDEMKTMADVYDTYDNSDMESSRVKVIAQILRVRAATPEDQNLDKLLYATVFGTSAEHPLKAAFLEKCKWHYVEYAENSNEYKAFMTDVETTAKAYGLK